MCFDFHMINLKEKVSKATEEGKRLKLRLRCARLELGLRPVELPTFRHNFVFFDVTSCVTLASSVEQSSEHKSRSIGFKSHMRQTLCH